MYRNSWQAQEWAVNFLFSDKTFIRFSERDSAIDFGGIDHVAVSIGMGELDVESVLIVDPMPHVEQPILQIPSNNDAIVFIGGHAFAWAEAFLVIFVLNGCSVANQPMRVGDLIEGNVEQS